MKMVNIEMSSRLGLNRLFGHIYLNNSSITSKCYISKRYQDTTNLLEGVLDNGN